MTQQFVLIQCAAGTATCEASPVRIMRGTLMILPQSRRRLEPARLEREKGAMLHA